MCRMVYGQQRCRNLSFMSEIVLALSAGYLVLLLAMTSPWVEGIMTKTHACNLVEQLAHSGDST
jgi:hypothetical protein